MSANTPEGRVKAEIRKGLAARGVVPFSDVLTGEATVVAGMYFMPVAGRYSVLGVHDFVGCWHSVFFSIETKAPNNPEDETFHQGRFREGMHQAGGVAVTGARDAQATLDFIEQRVMEIRRGRELSGAR